MPSKLSDLPVMIKMDGAEHISKEYVRERDEISSIEELKNHVLRWKNIWDLNVGREKSKEEIQLGEGACNYESAYKCLQKIRSPEGHCGHGEQFSCCAMHITLPISLMLATMNGHHFGVSTDIALIQITGGIGEIK